MEVIELNEDNFEEEVKTDLPVLIDFYAVWCGPCRMMSPVIEEIADEYEGALKVCKLDVDENPDIAARFMVESIPTLVVMKNGQTAEAILGYHPIDEVKKFLDKHIV